VKNNTDTSYGSVARALHWAVALLLITTFALGFIGSKIARTAETVELLQLMYSVHKTIGVTVLALAIARVLWALTQPRPVPLHPKRTLETLAGETVHWALYGALFIMPLSGWITHASEAGFAPILWPFGQGLPFIPKSQAVAHVSGTVHWLSSYAIFIALALHIAGALKHAVIDRDDTLARMTRGVSAGEAGVHAAMPKALAPLLAVGVWGVTLSAALILSDAFGHAQHTLSQLEGARAFEADQGQTDAPHWDVTDGALTISVLQMGADVAGQFATWDAAISYDDVTGAGAVSVVIDTASLTLGSVTEQALGPEFFNTDTFATAEFAGEITRLEGGSHVVEGAVTLLGKTAPVDLPFVLDVQGDIAKVSGTTQLDRREYGMGAGYPDEGTVGYSVQVQIELTATRAK
jgi:cytochrome b561/polyisoprenoid-binding protein YceI